MLAAIAYLRRNDFTEVCQLDNSTLRALDGTRKVFIWVSVNDGLNEAAIVPDELFALAQKRKHRLDVIRVITVGDRADIIHMMNAPTK